MSDTTIYHNPRCGKSRTTLALLERHAARIHVVEYLKTPPTAEELKAILSKLGIAAKDLVRQGEDIYKDRYADQTLTEAQWIEAMIRDPILIERPIVVKGDRAVLGRPPENVRQLF